MQINYLLSSIDKYLGFNKEQAKYLKKDIKENSIIVFIASMFSNLEKSNKHYKGTLEHFKNIGIIFKESYLINDQVSIEEAKKMLDKSDVVYIMGGDTLEQIKNINKYNLISILKNRKGITIGISAGSINMADNVVLARDISDNIPDHSFYKGIGLVDINIEPHFDFNNLQHNEDIIDISRKHRIICLPNDSFIRIENDIVEYIGDYYIYDKLEFKKYGGNV